MSDCCSSDCDVATSARMHKCPVNGEAYKRVAVKTMLHHIKAPWDWRAKEQGYYFCDDPDCDVVYFGEDGSVITQSALRTAVGVKTTDPEALACYCFGVSAAEARRRPEIRDYIMVNTEAGMCACDTSNPSGRCCLKDFPAVVACGH